MLCGRLEYHHAQYGSATITLHFSNGADTAAPEALMMAAAL